MIRVTDIKETKAAFKKQFANDCTGTFAVTINPSECKIRIATIDRFFNVRELYIPIECDYSYKKVTLSSVRRLDVLWDFIWSKDGFWMETYKNAQPDLETKAKEHNTIYTMAIVVFNTKRKSYTYHSYECESIQVIE